MSGAGSRAILTGMDSGAHSAWEGGFLAPCVLSMLRGAPRDVEELRELLGAFGFHRQVGSLRTVLHGLEADMLVQSVGDAQADGSMRRRYQLAAGGDQWLTARVDVLAEPARLLARFLDGYAGLAAPAPPGDEGGAITEVEDERR